MGQFISLTFDGVPLPQFAAQPTDLPPQHYASLVTDDHFERALQHLEH